MMWYPLTDEQIKSCFADLRLQVLADRFKSRSKYKMLDDHEFEWGIGYVVFFKTPGYSIYDVFNGLVGSVQQDPGTVSASLVQRLKSRKNTNWGTRLLGPDDGGFKNPDGLVRLLQQFGVNNV